MQIIGERLRALRKQNNLTQVQMSEILKVQQSRINRYETGASTPPAETFIHYADFFGVSMDYLYGRCDNPQGKLYSNQVLCQDFVQIKMRCCERKVHPQPLTTLRKSLWQACRR